jgi:hypothetical protein
MDRLRTFLTLALFIPLIGAVAVGCNTGTEEPDAPTASTDSSETGSEEGASDAGTRPPDKIDPSRFPDLPDGASAALPSNFPSDLPVYPGAVAAQGRGASDEGGEIAGVQLLTNDSPEQAFDYYQAELESKGWGIVETPARPDSESKTIAVTKDGCKAIFMFVPSESGTGTDIFTISNCEDV